MVFIYAKCKLSKGWLVPLCKPAPKTSRLTAGQRLWEKVLMLATQSSHGVIKANLNVIHLMRKALSSCRWQSVKAEQNHFWDGSVAELQLPPWGLCFLQSVLAGSSHPVPSCECLLLQLCQSLPLYLHNGPLSPATETKHSFHTGKEWDFVAF